MVKADVKHNYYADLDLPPTASLEDVRKAYRKLALQYHPDRNAGREEECVPKFQAIQSAIEVLGEPSSKQKYDSERKRVGITPVGQTFNPRQPAPGNPYAANTTFAPPPRRTQPGTWQRPPPTGADRFANFARAAPTAKQPDAAQETANRFNAWKHMQGTQGQKQRPPTWAPPQPAPPPQAQRPRPPPPPRQETRFPSEEQMNAGMRSSKMPPPNFDNKTAWEAFNKTYAGKPGMPRNAPPNTPRRQGFNPNMPGSDEKPTDAHYFNRKHSDGLWSANPGVRVAPPPSGPPPGSTPVSPISSNSQRPYPDHMRPHSSKTPNDQVPFAEGNRDRTPYASFIRERTDLGDGLRRSYSTRDTTKLDPRDATNQNRARSTSPLRRQRASESHSSHEAKKKAFDLGDSSSESSEHVSSNVDGTESERPGTAPNHVPPYERPKKVPTPPSSRFNGTRSGATSPPLMPNMSDMNGATNGTQSNGNFPGMQQKANSNMYATLSFSCRPIPKSPKLRKSDSPSTSRARRAWSTVGRWAIPSSVNPFLRVKPIEQTTYVTAADDLFKTATNAEQLAFFRFQGELEKWFKFIPDSLDMRAFLIAASTARNKSSCGDPLVDRLLNQVLSEFPTVGYHANNRANEKVFGDSFSFPKDPDMFRPTSAKSRSEENINVTFSSEPWTGAFGETDFAPPPPTGRKTSPTRRTTRTSKDPSRAATMDEPSSSAAAKDTPQRPWGSDGGPRDVPPNTAPAADFSQDQFHNPFSWQPSQSSTSPTRGGAPLQGRKQSQGRRTSKASNRGTTPARQTQQPQTVDEDDIIQVQGTDGAPEHGAPVMDEPEPMDIDNTPPAQNGAGVQQSQNEARLYNVPRSRRQEQEQKQQNTQRNRQASNASKKTNLKTNLDDLRNVEPIGSADVASGGAYNLESLGTNLPTQAQAAAKIIRPNKLSMPAVPKAPAEPTKLTKMSWKIYLQSFSAYIKAFHTFDQTMIEHFGAREQLIGSSLHDPARWLEAAGDTSGLSGAPTGFGTYLAMIQEDEQVRMVWNVGCEKRAEAVTVFGRVRDRVRKLVEGGGLADS